MSTNNSAINSLAPLAPKGRDPEIQADPQAPLQGKVSIDEFINEMGTGLGPETAGTINGDPKNGVTFRTLGTPIPPSRDPEVPSVGETVTGIACYEFHYFDLICGDFKATAFFGGYWKGGTILDNDCPDGPDGTNQNIQAKVIAGNGTDDCYSIYVGPQGSKCIKKNSASTTCPGTTKPSTPPGVNTTPQPIGQVPSPGFPSDGPAVQDYPINNNPDDSPNETTITLGPTTNGGTMGGTSGSGRLSVPINKGENLRTITTNNGDGTTTILVGKISTKNGVVEFEKVGEFKDLEWDSGTTRLLKISTKTLVGIVDKSVPLSNPVGRNGELYFPPSGVLLKPKINITQLNPDLEKEKYYPTENPKDQIKNKPKDCITRKTIPPLIPPLTNPKEKKEESSSSSGGGGSGAPKPPGKKSGPGNILQAVIILDDSSHSFVTISKG